MSSTNPIPLTSRQITQLEKNRCRCDDWSRVRISDGFDATRVSDTLFEGDISLGSLSGESLNQHAPDRRSEIRLAHLHDVAIGDNCRIVAIHGRLANLDIGDNVVIENAGTIECRTETAFGNGHRGAVLNEGGGRKLSLTAETSAQTAYLGVLYRHDEKLIAALEGMAAQCAERRKSGRASIGDGACIVNAQNIANVAIGPAAFIDGPRSLLEGTIESEPGAWTYVGPGVMAQEFIFQKQARVSDGAMVSGSLIGEAARAGKQFSIENSVLFANSEGFHSEVCSLFGGPYTVTHHRSTLLIAAMTSFYNAGSGTNQSNHMYKLGPLHQGILERGCKSGSSSYMLWPCRVGAFSVIIGKHYANIDTADFPFSHIVEDKGTSWLIPGMNLFTVGTMRDVEKWPRRDRRTVKQPCDLITFREFSPFTAQKMIRATARLRELAGSTNKKVTSVNVQGTAIKRVMLNNGVRLYEKALDYYFGDMVARRARRFPALSAGELMQPVDNGYDGSGEWIDMAGLICPKARVRSIREKVVEGKIDDFSALHSALRSAYDAYEDDEWNWFLSTRGQEKMPPAEAVVSILHAWKSAAAKKYGMILNDARREFERQATIGYGIDGCGDEDFEAVRGGFDDNDFVCSVRQRMQEVEDTADSLLARFGPA